MFSFQKSASVPLQLANGICKFAESLRNIPPGFVSLVNDLSISLVNHLIMWQHSTNQNALKIMLDVSCSLLMKTSNGIESLLTKATECISKGNLDFLFSKKIHLHEKPCRCLPLNQKEE